MENTPKARLREYRLCILYKMFALSHNLRLKDLTMPDTIEIDPEGWFRLADYCFWRSGIKSESEKFKHAVHAMKPRIQREMEDITTNTEVDLPYTTLKKETIERILSKQVQKVEKYLESEDMTAMSKMKPSELLKFVRNKAITKGVVNDNAHRRIWINHLPKKFQEVLKVMEDTRLDILVEIADKETEG